MAVAAPIDALDERPLPIGPVAGAFLLSVLIHLAIIVPLLVEAMRPEVARGVVADLPPEPAPAEDPRTDDPEVPLGIDESDAVTLNWIGYEEYQEHLAKRAEFDQAAFRDEDSGGAQGDTGTALSRPGEQATEELPPGEQPSPESQPAAAASPETPQTEPTTGGAQVRPNETPPGGRDVGVADAPEEAKEPPRSTPAPTRGPEAPTPDGPRVLPAESPEVVAPGNDIPAGTPRDEPPPVEDPEIPKPVDDPAPTPATDPQTEPTPSAPPADAPETPAPPKPQPETEPSPKPEEPKPEPEPKPQPTPTPQPTPNPQPTPTPAPTPQPPSEPKPAGAPPSGETEPAAPGPPRPTPPTPGESAPKESDAFSVIDAPPEAWKTGRPLAMKGLEILTRRPQLPLLTQLTTRPRDPIVEMRFDRTGKVVQATLLVSTGHENVDGPIVDSLYRWRARGELLERLKDGQVYVYRIRLVMQ